MGSDYQARLWQTAGGWVHYEVWWAGERVGERRLASSREGAIRGAEKAAAQHRALSRKPEVVDLEPRP